uniref:Uncharacterized protein n=1 Tax=Anopheles epiroticus TaxID=199890 RepID=A0A182PI84_9DIPT
MSLDIEDCDEEMQQLIADSVNLADELVTVTATEELHRTRHTMLSDLEADVEQYARTIVNYRESLERLALLEYGILHGLKKVLVVPNDLVDQLDRLEGKLETLDELIRERNIFLPPSVISNETFATIGEQQERLASLVQQLDRIGALIEGNQVRETAMSVASVQRKTGKLLQDIDCILKLNTLQKQIIVGFSSKIFHGTIP